MKLLGVLGLVLLLLGIASLFVPLPHKERHGLDAGDIHIGVTTSHKETVSPVISAVMIVAGAGLVLAGRRKGA